MISYKFRSDVNWRALEDTSIIIQNTMDLVPIIPNSSSMRVPCQSTKAISQSN